MAVGDENTGKWSKKGQKEGEGERKEGKEKTHRTENLLPSVPNCTIFLPHPRALGRHNSRLRIEPATARYVHNTPIETCVDNTLYNLAGYVVRGVQGHILGDPCGFHRCSEELCIGGPGADGVDARVEGGGGYRGEGTGEADDAVFGGGVWVCVCVC